jgi:hypothetical protein
MSKGIGFPDKSNKQIVSFNRNNIPLGKDEHMIIHDGNKNMDEVNYNPALLFIQSAGQIMYSMWRRKIDMPIIIFCIINFINNIDTGTNTGIVDSTSPNDDIVGFLT